eukprot:g13559.t1
MAKALLRVGVDPKIANAEGCIAMTYAAAEGSVEVVDMLLEKAPKTVSHVTFAGATPLYGAVSHGNEEAVVRLLAAEAVQPRRYRPSFCPPRRAIVDGDERLVGILLRRAKAVRGDVAIKAAALEASVVGLRARILDVLPSYAPSVGGKTLHSAASSGTLGELGVLPSDQRTRLDGAGWVTSEALPVSLQDVLRFSEEMVAALRRTLLRGAAFRARLWAWRAGTTGATATLRGDCGDAACGAGEGGDGRAREAGRARRKAMPLAVRIYRPEKKAFFLRHVGRFTLKRG